LPGWEFALSFGVVRANIRYRAGAKNKSLTYFVLALAIFVFLLALHAKLSLYQSDVSGQSGETSKLWLNGQKMDVLSSIQSAETVFFGLVAVILFFAAPLLARIRPLGCAYVAPRPFLIDPFRRSRFLRPPPPAF
jgi:hypothetical protein